eukprot:scaffold147727_cov27-Tisochrysis_lutea.AAC.1
MRKPVVQVPLTAPSWVCGIRMAAGSRRRAGSCWKKGAPSTESSASLSGLFGHSSGLFGHSCELPTRPLGDRSARLDSRSVTAVRRARLSTGARRRGVRRAAHRRAASELGEEKGNICDGPTRSRPEDGSEVRELPMSGCGA